MNTTRRRRRTTSTVVYIPVATFLIAFFAVFGVSAFLKVMYIEVDGASMYSVEEILSVAAISTTRNLLFLDTGAVSERLTAEMPYIREVRIKRIWPDTIFIDITESVSIATVRFHDDVLVIDSSCRVLARLDYVPRGLIEVRGFVPAEPEIGSAMRAEPGGETRRQYLEDVLKAIERAEACDEVAFVDVTNIGGITLWYGGRFEVVLGGSSNALQKLGRLPQIIEKINQDFGEDETGRINMSDASGESRFNQFR